MKALTRLEKLDITVKKDDKLENNIEKIVRIIKNSSVEKAYFEFQSLTINLYESREDCISDAEFFLGN